ncbi:MAG: MucR family transcriptional regulator [Deltaproteobacteria bacterium]
MSTELVELTADIVIAHASVTEMSSDDLLKEIRAVHATLEELEQGEIEISIPEPKKRGRKAKEVPVAPVGPAMTLEEAFKPDQVACLVCGKKGLTTLKRHLSAAHSLKPGQYRKQFGIPQGQPLAATDYIAKTRQAALDRGLGAKMAAARAAKKAKQEPAPAPAPAPAQE